MQDLLRFWLVDGPAASVGGGRAEGEGEVEVELWGLSVVMLGWMEGITREKTYLPVLNLHSVRPLQFLKSFFREGGAVGFGCWRCAFGYDFGFGICGGRRLVFGIRVQADA